MTISTQCLECKHYTGLCTCKAFPDKIPQEIFDGSFDHINEYPGDNGIKFEKESNISKGEKIIHIKGSSKVKAHKRKIKITRDLDRIGDKEKIIKGIVSTDYNESVKNMNNYISKLNDSDEGKEILKKVHSYTFINYQNINNYMKNPEKMESDKTTSQGIFDNLKNSISKIKKFINDAPKFKGEVYRGLQYATNDPEAKQRWEKFIKNIEGSKEIKFGSFLSTSSEKMVGVNFATTQHYGKNMKSVLIVIQCKSGVSIENISQVESEHEVLLDNDKTYKIIKFEKQDDRNHFLHLEEK